MSANEFDGAPLVAGTVKGVRSFAVDELGRLRGPQQHSVWRPGENVARCNTQDGALAAANRLATAVNSAIYGGYNITVAPVLRVPESRPLETSGHSLASCKCGFYAYHDGSDDYRADATVSAVVEGYGDVMLGTRGFRAEKARVLALCVPGPQRAERPAPYPWTIGPLYRAFRRLGEDFNDALGFPMMVATIFAAILFIVSIVSVVWHGAKFPVPWYVMAPVLLVVLLTGRHSYAAWDDLSDESAGIGRYASKPRRLPKVFEPLPAARLALVRRNYPDVPVFDSFDKMVAAVPPDRGVAPSPETDPTFWERP